MKREWCGPEVAKVEKKVTMHDGTKVTVARILTADSFQFEQYTFERGGVVENRTEWVFGYKVQANPTKWVLRHTSHDRWKVVLR